MSKTKRKKKKQTSVLDVAASSLFVVLRIVLVVLLVMMTWKYGHMAYDYGYRLFGEEPMAEEPGEAIVVTVELGDDAEAVAAKLKDAGLIRDEKLFVIQEKLMGSDNGIQPGSYTLNNCWTAEEMIAVLEADPDQTE